MSCEENRFRYFERVSATVAPLPTPSVERPSSGQCLSRYSTRLATMVRP